MKRICPTCKKVTEFRDVITTWLTLNKMQALQYCAECHIVVCILPVEQVKKQQEHRELAAGVRV